MIAIATGTRADWGLLSPLAQELRDRGCEVEVWTTNIHADPAFGSTAGEIHADGFDPVAVGRYAEGQEETVAENVTSFGRRMRESRPECIVVLGDRMEMLGVASAALLAGVPLVHIAGGTVSEGAVDDSIRNAISQMASLHLTETPGTAGRLRTMGIDPAKVKVCGALGVYNATKRQLMSRSELERSLGMELGGKVLVGTLHAATCPGPGEEPLQAMKAFLEALGEWLGSDGEGKAVLTWPNNDVDPAPQITEMERFEAAWPGRVKVVPSLGAVRYLSLVALSRGVVGNSSSGIVEVPSVGVPTLDTGTRQKGREHGQSVIHCGPTAPEIREGIRKLLSDEAQSAARHCENPYHQPDTPTRMAEAILDELRNAKLARPPRKLPAPAPERQ